MAGGTDTTELSLAALELDKLEACVELMFFAAYADGVVDASERAKFEEHVKQATNGQLGPALIAAVLKHIEGELDVAQRPQRLRAIGDRLRLLPVKRAALVLAMRVAMADGKLTSEERQFLMEAAAVFEIDEREALGLVGEASA